MPVTKHEIETALDNGRLWAAMRNNRFWRMRRNGATQLWKTRPAEFRIPVKAGLKATTQLTERSLISEHGAAGWREAHFVIVGAYGVDPNKAD